MVWWRVYRIDLGRRGAGDGWLVLLGGISQVQHRYVGEITCLCNSEIIVR